MNKAEKLTSLLASALQGIDLAQGDMKFVTEHADSASLRFAVLGNFILLLRGTNRAKTIARDRLLRMTECHEIWRKPGELATLVTALMYFPRTDVSKRRYTSFVYRAAKCRHTSARLNATNVLARLHVFQNQEATLLLEQAVNDHDAIVRRIATDALARPRRDST